MHMYIIDVFRLGHSFFFDRVQRGNFFISFYLDGCENGAKRSKIRTKNLGFFLSSVNRYAKLALPLWFTIILICLNSRSPLELAIWVSGLYNLGNNIYFPHFCRTCAVLRLVWSKSARTKIPHLDSFYSYTSAAAPVFEIYLYRYFSSATSAIFHSLWTAVPTMAHQNHNHTCPHCTLQLEKLID